MLAVATCQPRQYECFPRLHRTKVLDACTDGSMSADTICRLSQTSYNVIREAWRVLIYL